MPVAVSDLKRRHDNPLDMTSGRSFAAFPAMLGQWWTGPPWSTIGQKQYHSTLHGQIAVALLVVKGYNAW